MLFAVRRALPATLLGVLLSLAGCADRDDGRWQGYAEGEYLYLAAPRAGRLIELPVERGATVVAGARLFVLDPQPEAAAVDEARRRVEALEHRAGDLASGLRPSEVAAIAARLREVRAARTLAEAELRRLTALHAVSALSSAELDRARSEAERSVAVEADLEAQLQTARLGGRSDQRQAATAEAAAARAALTQAEWALAEKSVGAPQRGEIFDLLYRPGEYVPAGRPVVVLLPPQQVKARFFVPEPLLATLAPGQPVVLERDGVPPLAAIISFISPQAEFTPPVIYSRSSKSKLVYLVEARPQPDATPPLRPGQPLSVRRGVTP